MALASYVSAHLQPEGDTDSEKQMQKLYDIASAVPELLRHDYTCEPRMFTQEETAHLGKIVQGLYGHVARYRAGNSEFVRPLADAISWASLTVVQE